MKEKSREVKLRRAARRQGLELEKVRRLDPFASDFNTYRITMGQVFQLAAATRVLAERLTLDEVEARLSDDRGETMSTTSTTKEEKTREVRLRRMAERQNLTLRKARRRDPRAFDYGTYSLIDPIEDRLVGETFDLDEVERLLTTKETD